MSNLEKYCDDLKASIDFINGADIDERTRKTIRRALMSELELRTDELEDEVRYERQGKPFSKNEIELLRFELTGKIARSWDEESAILNDLSLKLRRKQKSVKQRAIVEGFQRAVDYWINRNSI